MRWRSLLVLVLLLLGGGTAVWFVPRAHRAPARLAPAPAASAAQPLSAAEPLESPAEALPELAADEQSATRRALAGAPAAAAQRKGATALRGVVLGEDDTPVQVFDLELLHDAFFSDEKASRHVESPDGSFCVESLTPGTWKIDVHAPAMVMKEPGFSVKLPHEPVLLRMRRTACISGLVLDAAGAPAEFADIQAQWVRSGAPAARKSVQSDAHGKFRFEDLEEGDWVLIAMRSRHEAPSERVWKTLAIGDVVEGLTLRLKSGGTIVGDLSPECLETFRDRSVNLFDGLEFENHRDEQIGQDGLFRFEHVAPGRWWIFVDVPHELEGPGLVALTAECVVNEGQTTQVHLGAPAPGSVRVHGRVLWRGSPVPGVQIAAFLDGVSALQSARMVRADAEGRYELLLGACGQATFLVSEEAADLESSAIHVRIPCVGEHALDLGFTRRSAELHGQVVDAAGKPLAERQVKAMSLDADNPFPSKRIWQEEQSDANGCFAITDLRPGKYLVLAEGRGGRCEALARQTVQVGESEVVEGLLLRLVRAGTVHGFVRTADGSPCAGLEVYARQASGELVQPTASCETQQDGEFVCEGLAPGRYTIFARGQAQELTGRGPLAALESAAIDVQAAQEGEGVPGTAITLLAVPASFVRVELRDAEGFSSLARVRVLDEAARDVGCAILHSDFDDALAHGDFGHRSRFGPLPPGRYRLEAHTEGGRVTTQAFTLAGEAEKQLTLRVE